VIALHNFSRASRSVEVKRPHGTKSLIHLFGRGVDEQSANCSTVDLDGYDY
jgi:hypothetical protein